MPTVRFLNTEGGAAEAVVPVGATVLEAAQSIHAPEGSACGGVCACSTCHVIVREGAASLPPADDDEEDQLDNARGLTLQSRLACQAVPRGDCDLVVEIPHWNRNLTKESNT